MLEEDTKCWICKRTESEIITEIKNNKWCESIFDEIRKLNKDERKREEDTTKEGVISLEDVGQLGYSYTICAICKGLIYSIATEAGRDTIEYEIKEGYLLTEDTVFKTEVKEL